MSAILLIAIPLFLAFVSMIYKKGAPILLILSALINSVLVFIVPLGTVVIGGYNQPLGISLFFDTYARLGLIFLNILFLIISFLNLKAFSKYAQVLMIGLVGLNGLLLTGDLFNLFVFLEITAISAYLITTSNKKPVSTFNYIVIGSIGSTFYLFGLAILYAMFGTLNMMDMIHKIDVENVAYTKLLLPFFLMFLGLGVDAKLLPLNAWVKGILKHSNTLSGPMIGSIYALGISLTMGRLITNLFQFEGRLLLVVVILLSLGILLGEIMAFQSSKIKEILLFSSIAQASIVMMLFTQGLVKWAIYLAIANAISKAFLFLTINHATHNQSDELDDVQGLFSQNKLIGVAFSISALSIIGLPVFVGFQIKVGYLSELIMKDLWLIVLVILASSVIEGIYMIRLLIKLWYPTENTKPYTFNPFYKAFGLGVAIIILVLGIYTKPLDHYDHSIDQVQEEIEVIYHG